MADLLDPPCSRASLERAEPLAGSAGFCDLWILIAGGVRSALELRERLPPAYLERSMEVLLDSLDFDELRDGEGTPFEGPLVTVCTDGKVDPCCAREGMSLFTRLREELGDRVWRVTHLGGCRFATNVASFPDGLLYGRVGPDDVPRFIEATRAGRIEPSLYRGQPLLDVAGNAAEIGLRDRLGEWRVGAFRLLEERAVGEDTPFVFEREPGTRYAVCVRPAPARPDFLTCRAASPIGPTRFDVSSIQAGGNAEPLPEEGPCKNDLPS